ncbi:sugar-binding protein [Pseudomonas asturiensis]|uniref:Sugar-binding protein n=1 Tax=Pseudomonas asturiensis TaxID=1190415 RepID=A0ABX6HEF2_9PSED|nr:RHS repeat protein [Pseudomonas asturiensis]QHF03968.1 sugar-binding protein [Pseudomonas asturiensis]
MTISTSVHSNAFNFMSFLTGGVDPRTGQYTISITLPDVKTNGLRGPGLPLALNYNPLNTQDSGFGLGWNLHLSQYTSANQVISLSSGETFKVDGTSGDELLMPEKKIDSFHFYRQDSDHFRVVHKSGLVEELEMQGGTGNRVALPRRVVAPEGHGLTLDYATFGVHPRLSKVTDDSGQTLLDIERNDTSVRFRLHAAQGADAEFVMILEGSEHDVRRIELPTDNAASWRFGYSRIRDHMCIVSVDTPAGGHEDVFYQDSGHVFPVKAGRNALPRVTRHLTDPGSDQPQVDIQYTYSDNQGRNHNFLGAGLDIAWEDNGLDNLYRYLGADGYDYVSTEALHVFGSSVRTIQRVFNQFHLLTSETTTQNGAVKRVETVYPIQPGVPFDRQPNQCQLPSEVITTWLGTEDARGVRAQRSESVKSTYDIHGNLITHTMANGVTENREWYSASGEDGCPPDPEGFVRSLKLHTVTPAISAYGQAPTLSTRYLYTTLPAIAGSQNKDWLVLQSETLTQIPLADVPAFEYEVRAFIDFLLMPASGSLSALQQAANERLGTLIKQRPDSERRLRGTLNELLRVLLKGANGTRRDVHLIAGELKDILDKRIQSTRQELQTTDYEHINTPDDAFQHGRVRQETLVMGGLSTTTDYVYSVEVSPIFGESVQRTVQTVTGFDNARKVVTLEHSLLNGEPLLNRDDNDVEIRYTYDRLRRVLSETVAPGTDFEAARRYEYSLCANTGEKAQQVMFDVKDVKTVSRLDGLQRVVYEERDDADNPIAERAALPRQTYKALYDPWGQLVEETEYDWLAEAMWPLTRTYEYDDWGEQRCVVGPDGVRSVEVTDPIGTAQSMGRIQRSWTEGNGVKSGESETWLNLFDKPTRQVRRDQAGEVVSQSQFHYDGLGRSAEEIVGFADRERLTLFAYDAFDRLIETTLPDGAIVRRSFVSHSTQGLPTQISVEHNGKRSILGEQVFDGLDRKIKTVTGGRERSMTYDPGQLQPRSVMTPSGQAISYEYRLQLCSEPLQRTLPGTTASYEYDPRNARLMHSLEEGEQLDREYYSTGELKSEQRVSNGLEYSMQYSHSRLGRLLVYTDVLNQKQAYSYNAAGQLESTELGTTSATFTYDALGRTASITTTDSAAGQRVVTRLEYDDMGREILRSFDLYGVEQHLEQVYGDDDDMIERRLYEGAILLREELYEYDLRGRLTRYDCSGPQCPTDPYGKVITQQLFSFDGLDNLTLVMTYFDGVFNRARYFYEGIDPVQLSRVTNTHSDYPSEIRLEYDADGNLILDEASRTLMYDALGRLVEISTEPFDAPSANDSPDSVTGQMLTDDDAPGQPLEKNGVSD